MMEGNLCDYSDAPIEQFTDKFVSTLKFDEVQMFN